MSEQEQAFLEFIKEKYISDVNDQLFQDILDNGIETVEQFEDAYSGQYRDGAEFSETLIDDCGYLEESSLPTFITNHIDWEDVWECELRHDYFMLTQDYKSHFFSRHF
tara:strand:- start:233 stop:556 length:324 start_codon:yes stop_codon:yes gene_type:complete